LALKVFTFPNKQMQFKVLYKQERNNRCNSLIKKKMKRKKTDLLKYKNENKMFKKYIIININYMSNMSNS